MSHADKLRSLPDGFITVASTGSSEFAIIAHPAQRIFGLQFHPEVTHTPQGPQLLRNFVVRIAGCRADWSMGSFQEEAVRIIRERVGNSTHVIGAVSGGVDSTVASALMKRAIGDRFHAVL
ncbi:MAG: glutamine amidotransferase-related protein, partial [Thermomonas sp.]